METSLILIMFSPLKTEKPLRPVYMRCVENEVAVVQYKLLRFFITVIQWPVVTMKKGFRRHSNIWVNLRLHVIKHHAIRRMVE